MRDDIAAADIDLLGEGQRHRVALARRFEIAVGSDDPRHMRALARRVDHHLLAPGHPAARQRPGIAAEIEMRPVHPLHWKAERPFRPGAGRITVSRCPSSVGP